MSSTTPIQLDDNLVNGQTYTFQLRCTNWIINPSASTIQQDLVDNAPDFLTSLQVTSPFTTSLYNCQFTYEGDGSDVVSDVANSMIAACLVGSNDNMVLQGAVMASASDITVSISNAAQQAEQAASNAVTKVGTDAAKAATDTINQALKGLLPLLLVVVGLVLVVLPSLVKSTRTKVSVG